MHSHVHVHTHPLTLTLTHNYLQATKQLHFPKITSWQMQFNEEVITSCRKHGILLQTALKTHKFGSNLVAAHVLSVIPSTSRADVDFISSH